jgi:superfamily I DNA/RNA helicase
MQSQDICLVARTNSQVDSYASGLKRLGVPVKVISRRQPDHRSTAGVRLATMHRVKGLEFRAVFMVGLNKGVVPLDGALRTKDPVEMELRSANERALFHVAATRAVKLLFLSSFGEASSFVGES